MRHDPGTPRTIDLPGDGRLELPDAHDGYASIVIRRSSDGAEEWRALPPDGDGDVWVGVTVNDDIVSAKSWSGWLIELDVATGNERARHFTK